MLRNKNELIKRVDISKLLVSHFIHVLTYKILLTYQFSSKSVMGRF